MNKFEKILEEKLLPLAGKLQSNKILSSMSSGLLAGMPFMIIGSLALVIQYPPIDYTTLEPGVLYSIFKGWADVSAFLGNELSMIGYGCMDCFALVSAAAVGYHLGQKEGMKGLSPMVIALVSFLMVATFDVEMNKSVGYFAGKGLLCALFCAVISVKMLKFLIDHRFGRIEIAGDQVPPAITESFITLAPCAVIVIFWAIVNTACIKLIGTPFTGLINIIMNPLTKLMCSPLGICLYAILTGAGWWCGIHDSAFGGVYSPFLTAALVANQEAYALGVSTYELPNIVSKATNYPFVQIGGCGATFALAILLMTVAKSKQCKTVGKLAIVPAFFNINEPLVFGLPIMMNPVMFVPVAFTGAINAVIFYVATAINLVPRAMIYPGWNVWGPIGGFIATLSWKGAVLSLVLIVIDALIYYPFLKLYDNQKLKEEAAEANN